jgi:hypothetical protein
VDYRRLFSDLHRRPSSYGLDGSYPQYIAFITGCDAGNDWGLLVGFPEWLAMKVDSEANLTWSTLVLIAAGLSPTTMSDFSAGEQSNSEATEALFALLDEFLSERVGARGASIIISRYAARR